MNARILAVHVLFLGSSCLMACSEGGLFSDNSSKDNDATKASITTGTAVSTSPQTTSQTPPLQNVGSTVRTIQNPEALEDLDVADEEPAPPLEGPLTDADPTPPVKPPKSDIVERNSGLAAWCNLSSKVGQMSVPGLKAQRDALCDGSSPSALFTTLIANASDAGSSDIKFSTLSRLASANRQTNVRFGFAIKIPTLTAKAYFEKVSAPSATAAGIVEIVERPGGQGRANILATYQNEDQYHVRGVLAHQALDKVVEGRDVTVESHSRYDHYKLEENSAYMFTSTVNRPISSIIQNSTVSALVQVDNQAYFVNVVDATVNNRGYPRIAEPELQRSSTAGASATSKRILANTKN